jgi:hypothetical protein
LNASGATGTNVGSYTNTITGTSNNNYNLTLVDGSLVIGKANLVVTADNKTRVYGEANPALTYTVTGYFGSDNGSVITGGPTLATAATLTSNVGNVPITAAANNLSATNYAFTYANGTMAITPASLSVTGANTSVTYTGQAQTNSAATITGLKNSDSFTITGYGTGTNYNATAYADNLVATAGAGTSASNYNISYTNGGLSIGKANATVTANSANLTYNGAAQSATGFTASGLVNSETTAVLTGITASGATGTNVGTYINTVSGTDNNYNLSFVSGSLVIGKANATVTANSANLTYTGQAQSVTGFTATGLVHGETTAVLTGVTASGATGTNAATYTNTVGGTDSNYNLTFVNGSLVIGKANATVTGNSATGTYSGQAQSVSGFTATGLVNNETITVLTGVTASGATGTNAGTYSNSVTSTGSSNYNLTLVNGSLVIGKANATVTGNSSTVTYNGAAQTVSGFTASGLVNGETAAVLTGVSAPGVTGTNAGTYTNAVTGTDSNYNLTFVDGSLVIGKANLVVTADNKTRAYGDANPALTYTVTGYLGSDNGSVITGAPTLATAANLTTNVGNMPITAAANNLNATNYNFTYANGTMAITPASLSVTGANTSVTYTGQVQANSAATITGLKNSDSFTITGYGTGTNYNATAYADNLVATAGAGTSASNYNISYTNGGLSIGKANATVTGNSSTVTYNGAAQTVSGYTVTGLVNGETASVLSGLSASGATGTNAGTYANTVTGTGTSNYNLTLVDGSLVIGKANATVTGNSSTVTYNGAAQTVSGYTVTGLVNGETASVLSGLSASGATGTNAGTYANTVTGTANNNYNLTLVDGALVIGRANVTVIGNSASGTYTGRAQSVSGYTVSGLPNGDPAGVITGLSASGASGVNAGIYINAVTGTATSNYNLTLIDGSLEISKVNATVTAKSATGTYTGLPQTVSGFTVSGLVGGETAGVLSGLHATGATGVNAGRYINSVTGSDNNYNLIFVDGSLVIGKANTTVTVTANSASRTYTGQAQSVSGFTATGLLNGETVGVLTGLRASGATGVNVGKYTNALTGSDNNYNLILVDGSLEIGKAELVLVADNKTRVYGDANPTLTYSVKGLLGNDNAGVLNSAPNLTTPANLSSNVGSWAITVTANNLTSTNYYVSSENGVMNITPRPITVTANAGQFKVVGAPDPSLTYSLEANGPSRGIIGSDTFSGNIVRAAGEVIGDAYAISKGTLANSNYTISFVTSTFIIKPEVSSASSVGSLVNSIVSNNNFQTSMPVNTANETPSVSAASVVQTNTATSQTVTTQSNTALNSSGQTNTVQASTEQSSSAQVSSAQVSSVETNLLQTNASQASAAQPITVQAISVQVSAIGANTVVSAQIPATLVNGFSFKVPDQVIQSIASSGNVVTAQLADGKELPSWLKFDPKTMEFKAQSSVNVFEVSDVIRVAIKFGNETIIVEIKAAETLDKR